MRYTLLLILSLILVVGCCHSVHLSPTNNFHYVAKTVNRNFIIPVEIDKDFNLEEKQAIIEAVGQWNFFFNGNITLKIINDAVEVDNTVVNNIIADEGVIILQYVNKDPDSSVIAQTDKIGGNIVKVYTNRWEHFDKKEIIAHELGHIFGAPHNSNKGSLMFATYPENDLDCVDQYTAYWILQGHKFIDPNTLNFCMIK